MKLFVLASTSAFSRKPTGPKGIFSPFYNCFADFKDRLTLFVKTFVHCHLCDRDQDDLQDYCDRDLFPIMIVIVIKMIFKTFSPCSWKVSLARISSSVERFWNFENKERTSGDDVNSLVVITRMELMMELMMKLMTMIPHWTNMVTPVVCSSLLIPFHWPFNRNLCLLPRPRGWFSSWAAAAWSPPPRPPPPPPPPPSSFPATQPILLQPTDQNPLQI